MQNYDPTGPILIFGVVGYFITMAVNGTRYGGQKRLDYILDASLKSYRALTDCSLEMSPEQLDALNVALAELHIFGSQEQVEMVNKMAARDGDILDEGERMQLLSSLRASIRGILRLPVTEGELVVFRRLRAKELVGQAPSP